MGDGADDALDRIEDAWEYNQRNPDDPDNDPLAGWWGDVDEQTEEEEPEEIRVSPISEEIDWIVSLEPICFPRIIWTREQLLREYSGRGYRILAVGHKAYVARYKWGTKFYITAIAVDPKHRRQGLAERLMREVMYEACEHDGYRIHLLVDAENEAAIRLYEKLGFVITGHVENYYEGKYDAFRMVLVG